MCVVLIFFARHNPGFRQDFSKAALNVVKVEVVALVIVQHKSLAVTGVVFKARFSLSWGECEDNFDL